MTESRIDFAECVMRLKAKDEKTASQPITKTLKKEYGGNTFHILSFEDCFNVMTNPV